MLKLYSAYLFQVLMSVFLISLVILKIVDENGNIWLNLDYSENYSGGSFMDEAVLGVILLDD